MKDQFLHKKFIFNSKIDSSALYALYEEDYCYIEEVFQTTLGQLSGELIHLSDTFKKSDISGVKKIVHKIKPAFGFVGLTAIQAACQKFEDDCIKFETMRELETPFYILNQLLHEGKEIIVSEAGKLKEYNASL